MGIRFCSEGDEWLKQAQRSCGMSVLEDTKTANDQCPQQPALKLNLACFEQGLEQVTP